MDSLFAIAFIKGMRDQERRQRVTFDLKDSPNFSFVKALTVVKFAFQEIGEPDPFQPQLTNREHDSSSPALYSAPVIPQVNAVGKAQLPTLAVGNSPLASPVLTQEQFNAFMSAYESSIGRLPRQPISSYSGMGSNHRNNPRVTCYNCGVRGHYSDTCNNTPLTAYEQQAIRDRIRRERDFTMQDFQ